MAGTISLRAPNGSIDVARVNSDHSIQTAEFRQWLESIGFDAPASEDVLRRPPEEVYVHEIDGEVAFVTFEFPPVADALKRLNEWEHFLSEVCDRWRFAMIGVDGSSTVPVAMFRSVLAQDATWKVIAEANSWPPIEEAD